MLKNKRLFTSLCLLTAIIVFFQVIFTYFKVTDDFTPSLFHNQIWTEAFHSWPIISGMLWFLLAQLFIYLLAIVFLWGVAKLLTTLFKLDSYYSHEMGIVLWTLGLLYIIIANTYLFPYSGYSTVITPYINSSILTGLYYVFSGLWLVIITLAVISLIKQALSFNIPLTIISVIVLATAAVVYYDYHTKPHLFSHQALNSDKPNVIIIGIDSLRPDYLNYGGYPKNTMPHVNEFLKHSTLFADTLTPLARTHPAWVSILTGNYPKTTGARFNLAPRNDIKERHSLAHELKQAGYHTSFGIDDGQFFVIDKSYGFDDIIGTPQDANLYLLATFNDYPLVNLMLKTPLGEWLFPYNFGSRSSGPTYDPAQFVQLIEQSLSKHQQQPLFIATHFCLPHLPFIWEHAPYHSQLHMKVASRLEYVDDLQRMDQQFANYMQALKAHGLLDNAIVVLLSDHGNSFGFPGDLLTTKKNNVTPNANTYFFTNIALTSIDNAMGHGTNVLSPTQYKSVLGFRLYGKIKNKAQVITQPTSLIDIAPTIFDLLHLTKPKMDGESLANIVLGKSDKVTNQPRALFLETGFTITSILTASPNMQAILISGMKYYSIDEKTGYLFMKPSMAKNTIKTKQRAIVYDGWMLADFIEDATLLNVNALVLVNLKHDKWTLDMKSGLAKQAPLSIMMAKLKAFYGDEIDYGDTSAKTTINKDFLKKHHLKLNIKRPPAQPASDASSETPPQVSPKIPLQQ